MTTTNIFLLKNDEDISKHTLLLDQDEERANQLIEQGKATALDLSDYEVFRTQATNLYEEYKAAESNIKESDDPRMTKEVKEWELGKLEQQLADDTAELDTEYQEYLSTTIEDARTRTARATTTVTPDDEAAASQILSRFQLQLASVRKRNQSEAVANIINDIALLTPEYKTAMQSSILSLVDNVGDTGAKRRIIEEVQDVGNMEAHALAIASQLPRSVTTEVDIERIIKEARK